MRRNQSLEKIKDQANHESSYKIALLFDYNGIKGWIIASLISISICLFFFFYHMRDWYNAKSFCFYDEKPTMATFDAYYFMRLTEDHLNENYESQDYLRNNIARPKPVPLLVRIAAFIKSTTGAPLEYIAWLLPPTLASFTIFIYGYWARFFSNPFLFIIASVTGSTAHVWFWRTSLGRFDTDSLNLLFPAILTASVYFTITSSEIRKKLAGFGILALGILLWHSWWPQGYNIGLLLALGTYGVSLLLIRSTTWENVLRGFILIGSIVVALISVLHLFGESSSVSKVFKPITNYVDLILKSKTSAEPSVGTSITELQSLTMIQGTKHIFGHWILSIPALIGTALVLISRPHFFILWAPFLVLGVMGFASNRLLIFLVPPLIFGLAFLSSHWIVHSKGLSIIPKKWKYLIATAVSIFLLLPNSILNLKIAGLPNVTADLVHLAKIIEPMEPKDGAVWAWWDYGYLLQYYAKKRTFIDGGTQTSPRIIISAYAFSTEDVAIARNWINSFAAHDLDPFRIAQKELGSKSVAFEFLKEGLKGKNILKEALHKYNQEHNEKLWQELLYPNIQTFLFIPIDFLKKTYWWYYYGSWDYEKGEGRHPIVINFPQWFVNVNLSKGYLTTLDGKRMSFGRYVIVKKDRFPEEFIVQPGDSVTTLFMTIPGIALITEGKVSESLPFKLYRHPGNYSHAFELIYYHPAYGGVWRTASTKN
ncbi:MAG: hypothetical protein N2260_05505 [Syntrophobacterales bacterium]|nr:hypothetical protein [Syntrophobacterales bacterium]